MSDENSTTIAAVIPKSMRQAAEAQVKECRYLNLSEFIRVAIREKLASPEGAVRRKSPKLLGEGTK